MEPYLGTPILVSLPYFACSGYPMLVSHLGIRTVALHDPFLNFLILVSLVPLTRNPYRGIPTAVSLSWYPHRSIV